MSDKAKMQHYDVVIVGGGLVGTTLACALAVELGQRQAKDYRIALVEAREPAPLPAIDDNTPFEPRVSALTQASRQLLTNIGVWPKLMQQRFGLMKNMCVWDAGGTGRIEFNGEELGQSELGFIIENRITVACLFERLEELGNIELIASASIVELTAPQGCGTRRVTLDDGRQLQAELVVGADGGMSKVRELAGIELQEKPYDQSAIVTTVKTEKPHRHTAWQRFLDSGPLAFLPLRTTSGDDHFCSIVWSLDNEQVDDIMALEDEAFKVKLERAFESTLGGIEQVDARFRFPLLQRHAQSYVRSGLALVGDAAHTIHPLAGQGVNLGLLDVAVLTEELKRAQQRELMAGEISVLQRYQRRRRGDNALMMTAMRGFKVLFAEDALPVRWLRNTGMSCLNQLEPIKNRVAANAMGLSGDLPALARPDYYDPDF